MLDSRGSPSIFPSLSMTQDSEPSSFSERITYALLFNRPARTAILTVCSQQAPSEFSIDAMVTQTVGDG